MVAANRPEWLAPHIAMQAVRHSAHQTVVHVAQPASLTTRRCQ